MRAPTALSGRIIPADAGSTAQVAHGQSAREDHPRGCGEHTGRLNTHTRYWGSSPRMRGAQVDGLMGPLETGIIPADAGSTVRIREHNYGRRDHPRGCGEHTLLLQAMPIM